MAGVNYLIPPLRGKPQPIGEYLTWLTTRYGAVRGQVNAHTGDLRFTARKRTETVAVKGDDGHVRINRLSEVKTVMATVERTIDALNWAQKLRDDQDRHVVTHVHKANPTQSDEGHDLELGNSSAVTLVVEVSDVVSSGTANRKMATDLCTVLCCPTCKKTAPLRRVLAVSPESGEYLKRNFTKSHKVPRPDERKIEKFGWTDGGLWASCSVLHVGSQAGSSGTPATWCSRICSGWSSSWWCSWRRIIGDTWIAGDTWIVEVSEKLPAVKGKGISAGTPAKRTGPANQTAGTEAVQNANANQKTGTKTAAKAGAPRSTSGSRTRQPAGAANSNSSTAATDAGPATTSARAKKGAGTRARSTAISNPTHP